MTKRPHRHIGVVLAVHPCGVFQLGTGILVSKNLVLTCAHNIHCKAYQNKIFPSIYFLPAQYGDMEQFLEVEDTRSPDEYREAASWTLRKVYDYALLKLKVSVNESNFI